MRTHASQGSSLSHALYVIHLPLSFFIFRVFLTDETNYRGDGSYLFQKRLTGKIVNDLGYICFIVSEVFHDSYSSSFNEEDR